MIFLVHLRELDVQAFLVVLVLFLEFLHFRLDRHHGLRRLDLLLRQREEDDLDDDGHQDNGEAIVGGAEVTEKMVDQRNELAYETS